MTRPTVMRAASLCNVRYMANADDPILHIIAAASRSRAHAGCGCRGDPRSRSRRSSRDRRRSGPAGPRRRGRPRRWRRRDRMSLPSGSIERGSRSRIFRRNGFCAEPIRRRVARLEQPDPDAAVAAPHQVVGIARQVVEQHLRLRRTALHVEIAGAAVDLPDPVAAGLRHEQRMPVGRQGDAVGEREAPRHHAGFPGRRIIGEHAAGRRLLHDVEHACLVGAAPFHRSESAWTRR